MSQKVFLSRIRSKLQITANMLGIWALQYSAVAATSLNITHPYQLSSLRIKSYTRLSSTWGISLDARASHIQSSCNLHDYMQLPLLYQVIPNTCTKLRTNNRYQVHKDFKRKLSQPQCTSDINIHALNKEIEAV